MDGVEVVGVDLEGGAPAPRGRVPGHGPAARPGVVGGLLLDKGVTTTITIILITITIIIILTTITITTTLTCAGVGGRDTPLLHLAGL